MGWQDQGRQYHGWFGDGTSEATLFEPGSLTQRIEAVANGAIGSLPADQRSRASAQNSAGGLSRLAEVMGAWVHAVKLDPTVFAARFLGRTADDPIVRKLRNAAQGADMAQNHADLRRASESLAGAIQAVGLDNWQRFLADAQDRAGDPATIAAVAASMRPRDPKKDAIEPVDPVGDLLGVAGAGIPRVAAAAARAVGGLILRQTMQNRPRTDGQPAPIDPSENLAKAIRKAQDSIDPAVQLEGQIAQRVKNAGIEITAFKRPFGPNQSRGEIDIETPQAIVEVTLQRKGKMGQVSRQMYDKHMNPEGKSVILFAPNYGRTAGRAVTEAGGFVARTPDELINLLRAMGAP